MAKHTTKSTSKEVLFYAKNKKWQGQVRGEGEKWTIRGLSLRSKKTYGFPNPFTGSRPYAIQQKTDRQTPIRFLWWTIRDSNPRPID